MSPPHRIGAIDVGTNSVLLTIAERQHHELKPLLEEATITRIGEGLGTDQKFKLHAMERTAQLLDQYVKTCHKYKVDQIIAVGTAAFRRALNAKEFIRDIKEHHGIDIEIISGEREAGLSYDAASHDFGEDLLVVDIGGGSTEFIWNERGVGGISALSLPLGSVTLNEHYVHSDPINDEDYAQLQTAILSELLTLQGSQWGGKAAALQTELPKQLVALAGTATTLVAMHLKLETYSHAEVHGTKLTLQNISSLLDELRARPIEERKKLPGLEPARADVILEGAVLLQETMKLFDYDQVTISDRGVRWGLIYEYFQVSQV